jgi:quinoprotein dehydrogenase-associated probable ABC transporter substrate-binding protein
MSSGFRELLLGLLLAAALPATAGRDLRVCADPDNLPFSHRDGSGFENRIAALVAEELGATLTYEWAPLLRGFVRKTIGSGACDLFIGVPAGFERVTTTRPYYRSTYVFLSAAGIDSFDDPRLAFLRLAVQLPGDDLAATPPGHALAMKGYVDNVRGFTPYGETPAAQRIVAALDRGELDAAIVWGPQAGYFAAHAAKRLHIRPAHAPAGLAMPFEFAIAMGVRRGDRALRDELDAAIERRRGEIDAVLADYHVPRVGADR